MPELHENAVLAIEGLGFSFGAKPVLEDIDLTVRAGEFKLLLGPNGAGKTTLFSLITRLYDSPRGRIEVDGNDLKHHSGPALRRMGVVFQQPTLDLDLTVRQNLMYHAALHGLSRAQAEARMTDELNRLGMAERIDERVRKLNGGHRRRVEIVRALMHEPKLLLLDEPTVGLDVPTRRDIVDHVHGLARDAGIAVLWATHLIDEVMEGDSVFVLHQGIKRADGTLAQVLEDSATATIADAYDTLTRGSGTKDMER
jgi:ABC-2 type transport system ATP-binding protein